MYAVIRSGGKQYRVAPGQQVRVERLPGAEGDTLQLTEILMVGGEGAPAVGAPLVPDASVTAEIVRQGRDKKVTIFKYKNKIRYRKRRGHRQPHTLLAIREITGPDGTVHTAGEEDA